MQQGCHPTVTCLAQASNKLGRWLIVHMPKVKARLGADWNKLQQPADVQAGLRRLGCVQRPSRLRVRQAAEQLLLLWRPVLLCWLLLLPVWCCWRLLLLLVPI